MAGAGGVAGDDAAVIDWREINGDQRFLCGGAFSVPGAGGEELECAGLIGGGCPADDGFWSVQDGSCCEWCPCVIALDLQLINVYGEDLECCFFLLRV